MSGKSKRRTAFAVLAVALGVPFALKFFCRALEPYPAVIFPSGAKLLHRDAGALRFSETRLYGPRPDGRWKRLNVETFLAPLPEQYFKPIVDNRFGLDRDLSIVAEFKRDILPAFEYRNAEALTPENIAATRRWLRRRLRDAGLETDGLRVVKVKRYVDPDTRETLRLETIDETIYPLR